MPGTRELSRRIKSVKSTRKITRAMQMVSAAKMRKSQNRTLSGRHYAVLASSLASQLSSNETTSFSLTTIYPKAKNIGAILITTNRGLVGSFNVNLVVKLKQLPQPKVISVGKKGRDAVTRLKYHLLAEFEKPEGAFDPAWVYPLAKIAEQAYATGEYEKIVVIYNQFVSTLVQKPIIEDILPIRLTSGGGADDKVLYEPSPEEVLQQLLPRILENKLYQALLESDASEHSARMVMMKNATEAAGDLIDDLTLTFNQLRQNKITTELSEITAGKLALEG